MKEGQGSTKSPIIIAGTQLIFEQDDIASAKTDAIVNAANRRLWMGGGVAGAIKKAGGLTIEQEAVIQGPIDVGEVVVTSGGHLKAEYVFHAVAIDDSFKATPAYVEMATENCILKAEELGLKSLAFPALGAGVGGLSLSQASRTMAKTIRKHLSERPTTLELIVFVLLDASSYREFSKVATDILLNR